MALAVPASPGPEEALVERVAEAMFATHNNAVSWKRVNEHIKRQYRKFAATAIREVDRARRAGS